jgi:hypothetical protein
VAVHGSHIVQVRAITFALIDWMPPEVWRWLLLLLLLLVVLLLLLMWWQWLSSPYQIRSIGSCRARVSCKRRLGGVSAVANVANHIATTCGLHEFEE